MGILSTYSSSSLLDTEPASESELPKPKPTKPTTHHGCPTKPHIIKEKVYKIRRGRCMTWRRCTLCRKQFARQLELNHHSVDDHNYQFLCSWQTCTKAFTSQSALDKHSITHKPVCFMCAVCSREFYQKYQLESHKNVHDPDKEYRCVYPRCTYVYKRQGEYNHHYKSHCGEYKEYGCTECDKKFTVKKNLDQHMELHSDIFKEVCKRCGK